MNELMIFENTEFGQIRTTMIDEEPWFVGKDVADALGYKNTRVALQDNVHEDDKVVTKVTTLGGSQNTIIINESGFYCLVFGSRLKQAIEFKRWVTSEVLPTLRKTGQYSMKSPSREEYVHVAEIIAKCPNTRLPLVMNVLGKAGFEFDEADVASDTELIDLLNQFSLPQLVNILGLPKSSLHYYRTGQHQPPLNRRKFIINTLRQQRM